MDWQRTALIAGMCIVAWMLMIQWNQSQEQYQIVDTARKMAVEEPVLSEVSSLPRDTFPVDDLPQLQLTEEAPSVVAPRDGNLITIKNDVIELAINTMGGDIVGAKLLKHFDRKEEKGGNPFIMLENSQDNTYIARSGIIGPNGTDTAEGRPQFLVDGLFYQMAADADQLTVRLSTEVDDISIVKSFTLNRESYAIEVQYFIDNASADVWNGTFYGQIKRDSKPPVTDVSGFSMQPYLGAALRQSEKNYAKFDFSDIDDKTVKTTIEGGWVAMVQHYFISAWIPPKEDINRFTLRKLSNQDIYLMSFTGSPILVRPGQTESYKASFYVGPKDQETLANLAEYLDRTVDYGFLWVLAEPIFKAMKFIHGFIGNWGWTIIVLTIAIKLLLYPLSAASLKSMAKMRSLQPELTRLKELHGDDRQKMSQELMNLYKKEKVNPAGGCFPMLLQMPVFIALYWVLMESVEIRHAPWFFWIQDLSAKDPYFVLPIIMGASMLLMQKLQPMPTDPMQAKVMQIMPIAFTFLFMGFPSGLVLYWTVNNLLSMAQQWFVNRQIANGKS
ncbi:membrane protein insertase YidC [Porticoccaceae bacterium]|nr:membrane protein insertase YidC [Porticoccaceae bacterium]